jgi:hypothetical protein
VEYNYSLIKVGWLDACITLGVVGAVMANEKQGPIHEEMSQTLLTDKKQGNLD